eukprot:976445-Rhodomonas_salina.1
MADVLLFMEVMLSFMEAVLLFMDALSSYVEAVLTWMAGGAEQGDPDMVRMLLQVGPRRA